MAKVCVLLAPGFEEIEAVTVIDVLRRAAIETVVVGVGTMEPRGSHEIVVNAEMSLDEARRGSWDAVVLPGGMPGAEHLRADPGVRQLLESQRASGAKIAAICAAPIVLEAAGLLHERRATSYPAFREQLSSADYREEAVVVDGELTTSRGPGTAMAFALSLVEQLAGASEASKLAAAMLVR